MRLHLFEFEDQPWFPAFLRQPMQEHLEFMGNLAVAPLDAFARQLAAAMQKTGDLHVVDLASGGGGPVRVLLRQLAVHGVNARVTLTDLFPNVEAFQRTQRLAGDAVSFETSPVDATRVPEHLRGFRLMFNSFHHMPPHVATAILADAARQRQGLAVLEIVGRNVPSALNILSIPLLALVLTPFVRPFRWSRLLLTYVLPLIPLLLMWDGAVSCLRVYSPAEMDALLKDVPADGYHWETGMLRVGNTPVKVTYLLGHPHP